MTDQLPLTRVLRNFASLLAGDYQTSDVLNDLVKGATDILSVAGAAVSLRQGDRMTYSAAANELVGKLERVQESGQIGPAVVAHHTGKPILVTDFGSDGRWPKLADIASGFGISAAASIPMSVGGTKLGSLTLYDDSPREWSGEDVSVAQLLAETATGFVANASRLDKVRITAEQLQTALDSRVIIEQAKGVLAGERNISTNAAFEVLRSHARNHSIRLHSVAEAVVNLGLRP